MPAQWTFKPRKAALKEITDSILGGTAQSFQEDILPEAQRESPKLTGKNASSIKLSVDAVDQGVQVTMYTDDGYGGYVEAGTKKMDAEPYLFPSFSKLIGGLPGRVKAILEGFYR